jgi:2-polyprenyl-3-methyl-5-hydroxy-6-metoxy-1,4-benzoquinol methylase
MTISDEQAMNDGDRTAAQAEAFVGRLFEAGLGAFDVLTVYLGDRLGLYEALARVESVTPGELAAAASIHERYAREWLEQQAATGVLTVDDPAKPASGRRYSLPPGHAEALTKPDSMFSIAPMARALISSAQTLPLVMEAYRTGGGVPWSAYGDDGIESQGDYNRPWLVNMLGSEFLPAMPDVHERLTSDLPARVADVACGVGWAAISIAKAYPNVRVDGFDPDERSIEIANGSANEAGVEGRVRFEVRDAQTIGTEGPYDLAIVVEALHDVARPVEILSAIRTSLAPSGSLLVADERVGDTFTAPSDEVDRFMYAASVLVCLPGSMAEQPSAATGTVMRADTVRDYAARAGFGDVEVLPFEPGFLRFYRLRP